MRCDRTEGRQNCDRLGSDRISVLRLQMITMGENWTIQITMPYTICRIQKLKHWSDIGGSAEHTTRSRSTPNADPNAKNLRLIGKDDDPDLGIMVKEKIGNQKIRKNAVLAVEILLGASAEYFRPSNLSAAGAYDQKRLDDFNAAAINWLVQQYQNRVVRAECHLDEMTPHIHAYMVPLDERGKLNCRALLGGSRYQLSELQSSFARAMQPLGIERGIKGSRATHIKIKKYYEAVNQEPFILQLERLAPKSGETAWELFERIKSDPVVQICDHQLADRVWQIENHRRAEQKAQASEKLRQQLAERVVELEAENSKLKQQVNQFRELSLEDVAYGLGLDLDNPGKNRWKCQERAIAIDGTKFYDLSTKRGGRGAIDLVMQVEGCEFKQAVAWMRDRFGELGILAAVAHHAMQQVQEIGVAEPAAKFVPPPSDESQWEAVERYLSDSRKLPREWIRAFHHEGLIYADARTNAVFLMRSLSGEVTGAFLRGTTEENTFVGYAKDTKRTQGWFYLRRGGAESDTVERAVLCRFPIDALSKAVLEGMPRVKTLYLAADSHRLPVDFLKDIPKLLVSYNNDDAGNELSRTVKEILPQAIRQRPKGKDWNDDLVRTRQLLNLERE